MCRVSSKGLMISIVSTRGMLVSAIVGSKGLTDKDGGFLLWHLRDVDSLWGDNLMTRTRALSSKSILVIRSPVISALIPC